MKLAPIVNHIQRYLPFFTDQFSQQLAISNVSVDGSGVVTVTTAVPHGLTSGDGVVMTGTDARLIIDVSKTTINGNVVTFHTIDQHNLIQGDNFKDPTSNQAVVELSGFNDPFYDGTHNVKAVPSGASQSPFGRREIVVEFDSTPPPITASQPLAFDGHLIGNDGYHEVTVVDATSFTYQLTNASQTNIVITSDNMQVHKRVRVAPVATLETILDAYTKQGNRELWAFVAESNDTISTQRTVPSDAQAIASGGSQDYRFQVIDNVAIVLIQNTSNQAMAAEAHDNLEDAKRAIVRTIAGVQSINAFSDGNTYLINYIGSQLFDYNKAYLAKQLNFQAQYDILTNDVWHRRQRTSAKYIDLAYADSGLTSQINL